MTNDEKMDDVWEQSQTIIAKIISKEEYESYHKSFVDMWEWLAENCQRDKEHYFKFKHISCNPTDEYCFACVLCNQMRDSLFRNSNYNETVYDILKHFNGCLRHCDFCPLKSHLRYGTCNPLYSSWEFYTDHDTSYAKEIAKAEWYSYEDYCNILRILHDYYRVGEDKT